MIFWFTAPPNKFRKSQIRKYGLGSLASGYGTCWRKEEGSVRHDELDVDGPLDQLTVLVLKHVQEYLLALRTHVARAQPLAYPTSTDTENSSVADPDPNPDPDPPDPHVFGPPGSGSIIQRYGSGSFYH
jgi:hypothetical protein